MAFDAFALVLAMLALGLLFQRLRLFPVSAPEVIAKSANRRGEIVPKRR